MNDKITLNVSEVAELLGISKSFVYQLVGTGKLPAIRLGKRILFTKERIMEYIAQACS